MADVLAVRDEYRAQTWAMLIQECNSSGLTKREFCQQRGISEKSFYYWLRKLRSHMAEVAGPQLVQLDPDPAPDPGSGQVRDRAQDRAQGQSL